MSVELVIPNAMYMLLLWIAWSLADISFALQKLPKYGIRIINIRELKK